MWIRVGKMYMALTRTLEWHQNLHAVYKQFEQFILDIGNINYFINRN